METYDCPECNGKMKSDNFVNIFRCRLCDLVLEEKALEIIKRLTSERDCAAADARTMAFNSNVQMNLSDGKDFHEALVVMEKYKEQK